MHAWSIYFGEPRYYLFCIIQICNHINRTYDFTDRRRISRFIRVFTAVITIMRYQRVLAVGYIVVSLIAFFMSDLIVSEYGIMDSFIRTEVLFCLGISNIIFFGGEREQQFYI